MEGEGLLVTNQHVTHARNDEDELQPLAPRQIVHFTHCISCHVENCDMERTVKCFVLRCPQCAARMHECKIEEHLNEICPKAIVPCINASFGCDRMVRRDKKSRHLERCCASVVVCGREWARYALSPMSKLQLKNWGKKIEAEPVRNFRNLPLDIALTFSDQDVIVKSYGFSRVDRVRRRDGLHPSHPVLPLRELRFMLP
ncbi:unnamed protein product [Cylicostephanus goldi]|uniref:TRAF-type domain-containing protein n=1 Tax=Cylicostephanus goldi TaxID=71465 RepID=A0A3P6QHQ8_CYLGO|nr:unnamed protein product [Cylicostephanus goldi]